MPTLPDPPPPTDPDDTAIIARADQVMADFHRLLHGAALRSALAEESAVPPRRLITQRVGLALRAGMSGVGPDLGLHVVNVSPDGLGVRLRMAVPAGTVVTVTLTRLEGGEALDLVGEVRWCEQESDGTYLAGVILRRRLTGVELTHLTG